jgi:MFS family permease
MLSRGFVVLWLAMLVAMLGIGMVSPLLPVYVRDTLHGPPIAVALSFSGLALAQLVAAPFVGRLGDRIGPKPFIVGGFFVYALGAVGYVFAPTWHFVVLFRVLSGFGAAGIFPMTLAYIGRLAPPGREGTFMGAFSISSTLGFGLGPLLGGGVRDAVSADAAFTLMGLLLAATGLATLLLLPGYERRRTQVAAPQTTSEPELSWRELIVRTPVQAALAVQTVVSLGWGAASSFMAIFIISDDGLATNSALFVGVLLAMRSLLTAVLQPVFGPLADRVDRLALVILGLAVSAAAQFAFPAVPRTLVDATLLGEPLVVAPWLLFLVAIVGFAEAVAFPAQQAIFVTVGRSVGMGSIMGLNQMGSSVGFLAGSLLGALVVSIWDLDAVFRYAGILTLTGAVVFGVLMVRANRELRAAEADRVLAATGTRDS